MLTKLLKTNDYLLLIDEEAEIKEGDLIYYEYAARQPTDKDSDRIKIFDKIVGADKILAWFKKDDRCYYIAGCNKIIAYYPLSKEAKELDLPLLPNGFERLLKFKTNLEGKEEIQGTYKY